MINDEGVNQMRRFEVVRKEHRKYPELEITLPTRGSQASAGYDFRIPVEVVLQPGEKKLIFSDVKAYMEKDEVLKIYPRSGLSTKKGIVLSNITAIIDSDYVDNQANDGNIGLSLWNTSDEVVVLEAGERVCQGIFLKYLTIDDEEEVLKIRNGGFGSSGRV